MATKKRTGDKTTTTTTRKPAGAAPKKTRAPKAGGGTSSAAARRATTSGTARPKLRASHASATAAPKAKKRAAPGLARRRSPIAAPPERGPKPPQSKRTPLGAPKRTAKREVTAPVPSDHARELAVSIAVAGLDKKALAIEILDVTGKVDYADFLVVMTGRSDRHVHSIATGIEEALVRKNKVKPLSVEGLTTATWVLIDFGDVVVHVFQEDARRLYDIEGLWIDAGRVPLPEDEQKIAAQLDETEGSSI